MEFIRLSSLTLGAPEDSVKKQPARRTNDDIDYMRFAPTIGKRSVVNLFGLVSAVHFVILNA